MKISRVSLWAITAVVFLLAGAAVFERSKQGVSALFWGWRQDLAIDQPVDVSQLAVKFGIYDLDNEFADYQHFAFEHIFISWLEDNQTQITTKTNYATERDRWLLITIEPYARTDGTSSVDGLFSDIRSGGYDTEIKRVCASIASQERPVFIRWGHEMDVVTGRYDWAQHDADGYVESFRYFVTMCQALVPESWYVWSPISEGSQMFRYWPGGDYVDRIGLPVFAFPERDLDLFGHLRSFQEIFSEKYERVSIYKKQIMIAELGVAGESHYQASWMMGLFRSLENYPLLTSAVYFNNRDNVGAWEDKYTVPDWRIEDGIFE